MADFWLMRDGGTRATATGASVVAGAEPTQAEWDNLANCFDTNEATVSAGERWWNVLRDDMADTDEMIFYDTSDGSTAVYHDLPNGNMATQSATGTFTIRSRSGDSAQCVLRGTTVTTIFDLKPTTDDTFNYIFTGLKFAVNGTDYASNDAPYVSIENKGGDVTFNNCSLGNLNYTGVSIDNTGGFMRALTGKTRTVTFNNTNFENITSSATWIGGSPIGVFNSDTTVLFTGTCYIRNITLTSVNGIRGAFYGTGHLTITGDVIISDISKTVPSPGTDYNYSVFYMSGAVSVTGTITANTLENLGGQSGVTVIACFAAFDVSNITASGITVTQATGENSVGAVFLATGASATGTVRNVDVSNVAAYSSGAIYFSNGANGTIESVIATNCSAGEHGGGIYIGGGGSAVIRGVYLENCSTLGNGGGIFGFVHTSTTTAPKTIEIYNATIINCSAVGDGQGIMLNNDNTTHSLTSTITNCLVRNGSGTDEINLGEGASSTHDCTISYCDIEGDTTGIDSEIGAGSGTLTATTAITDDSTQINTNGTLVKDAAYKTTGSVTSQFARDANGRPFGVPPAIGGFGTASCSANTRNPRV